jgi:hypothetical protein
MLLYAHPLYTFHFESAPKLIRMTWTPATAGMGLDDFKEALHNLAGFAFNQVTHGILVDVRQFRYRPPAELGSWRDEVISPRYVKAGIRRFAYLATPEVRAAMARGAPAAARGFEEGYFDDEAQALGWLGA